MYLNAHVNPVIHLHPAIHCKSTRQRVSAPDRHLLAIMSLRRLSNASRTLSANSLKERLSKLTTTPLVPVATALQANIEFVRCSVRCLS